jgi:hypothetical protein
LRRKVGPDVRIPDAYGILNEVSMDILSRMDFQPLWKRAILRTVAPYDTGTVSVNVDSTTVTGVGTTFTSAMVDRKIKLTNDTAFYRIASFTDATHIELETAYAESANASGETYEIWQDEYSLESDFDGFRSPIRDLGNSKLLDHRDLIYGETLFVTSTAAGSPDMVVPIGVDSSGNYMVRLQPPPNAVHVYDVRYRKNRTILDEWDDLIDFPPKDEEMFMAGLVARVQPTKGNIGRFENYFSRFQADAKKDDNIRYVRSGMKRDFAGQEWPRHAGGLIGQ